ncbi:hypothetical protein DFJ73DRAFT_818961 [Zopfochytrium polystomum]|nr:hypothetical protein DFJ73DRAFT_818961 [Zopfochytrium polystomum]
MRPQHRSEILAELLKIAKPRHAKGWRLKALSVGLCIPLPCLPAQKSNRIFFPLLFHRIRMKTSNDGDENLVRMIQLFAGCLRSTDSSDVSEIRRNRGLSSLESRLATDSRVLAESARNLTCGAFKTTCVTALAEHVAIALRPPSKPQRFRRPQGATTTLTATISAIEKELLKATMLRADQEIAEHRLLTYLELVLHQSPRFFETFRLPTRETLRLLISSPSPATLSRLCGLLARISACLKRAYLNLEGRQQPVNQELRDAICHWDLSVAEAHLILSPETRRLSIIPFNQTPFDIPRSIVSVVQNQLFMVQNGRLIQHASFASTMEEIEQTVRQLCDQKKMNFEQVKRVGLWRKLLRAALGKRYPGLSEYLDVCVATRTLGS